MRASKQPGGHNKAARQPSRFKQHKTSQAHQEASGSDVPHRTPQGSHSAVICKQLCSTEADLMCVVHKRAAGVAGPMRGPQAPPDSAHVGAGMLPAASTVRNHGCTCMYIQAGRRAEPPKSLQQPAWCMHPCACCQHARLCADSGRVQEGARRLRKGPHKHREWLPTHRTASSMCQAPPAPCTLPRP